MSETIHQIAVRELLRSGIEPADDPTPILVTYHHCGQEGLLRAYDETLGSPMAAYILGKEYHKESEVAPQGIDTQRYRLYMLGQVCLTGRERDIINSST
jgi:hypothetical protein